MPVKRYKVYVDLAHYRALDEIRLRDDIPQQRQVELAIEEWCRTRGVKVTYDGLLIGPKKRKRKA
jgi:hypothetical protein